ncbi:MAG: hypothetical protein M3Z14_00970 [Candidatus Eremiobacteraeota bacterium]|nr:hypothetical protein [Candidatus Eremiobacteraeota bacterium]
MKHLNPTRVLPALAIAVSLALGACGGNKGTTTTTMGNQARTEGQREANALPLSQAARIPGNLHCGATRPVWVNMRTKTYHAQGDPYYGRTRNGEFMCPSAAASAGYHLAGARHRGMRGGKSGSMNSYDNGSADNTDVNGASTNGTDMNGGNPNDTSSSGKHHRHKRHSSTY